VEIYGADGELIKSIPGGKRRGINRVSWPMRLPPPKVPPATNLVPAFEGPRVLEGTYTVKLIKGKKTLTGSVELVPDPRSPHSAEDRKLQQKTALDLYHMLERMTYLVDSITDLRDQARARAAKLPDRSRTAKRLTAYADSLEQFRGTLVSTSEAGWLSGEERLREKLGNLYGGINSYTGRPTKSQLDRLGVLRDQLEKAFTDFDALAGQRDDYTRSPAREARSADPPDAGSLGGEAAGLTLSFRGPQAPPGTVLRGRFLLSPSPVGAFAAARHRATKFLLDGTFPRAGRRLADTS
jgi:hypothetical protein